MAYGWFWTLTVTVPVILYLMSHQNTSIPEGYELVKIVPTEQPFIKQLPMDNGKTVTITRNKKPEGKLGGTKQNQHSTVTKTLPPFTKKEETVNILAERRKNMKQFVNILYSWSEYDQNFDAALKEMGYNSPLYRKIAKSMKVKERLLENENNDGAWDYNLTMMTGYHYEYKFKLGVPVKYETMDGRQVESTFTLIEKNVLNEEQTFLQKGRNRKATFRREYSLDQLIITFTIDNVITVQTFKAK